VICLQFLQLRNKVIINKILAIIGNNLENQETTAAAIEVLEQQRIKGSASLDKLIKIIKKERKYYKAGGGKNKFN
jgi:hypothetical protein